MSVHCLVEATARLDEPTREKHLPTPLMYSNVEAHAMRLAVVNNDGTPADLTDVAASATFLRSDNSTVEPILGEITGNVVEVILPGSCYTVPGRFEFSLNLAYGAELRTAMFVTGFVKKATSEDIIDPGTPVGNIDQVVAQAGAAATAAANAAASATSAAAAAQEVVDNVEDDISDLKSNLKNVVDVLNNNAMITNESDKAFYHNGPLISATFYPNEYTSEISAKYSVTPNLIKDAWKTGEQNGITATRDGRFIKLSGTGTGGFNFINAPGATVLGNLAGKKVNAYLYLHKATAWGNTSYFGITANGSNVARMNFAADSTSLIGWTEFKNLQMPDTLTTFKAGFNSLSGSSFANGDYYWFGIYESELTDTDQIVSGETPKTFDMDGINYIDTALHESVVKIVTPTKQYVDDHTPDIIGYWNDNLYALPEKFGAVGDGVTDDAQALSDCIAYAISTGKPMRGFRKYKTSETITLDGRYLDVYLNEIIYTGNQVAVNIVERDIVFDFHRIQSGGIGISFGHNAAATICARQAQVKGNKIESESHCIEIMDKTLYGTCDIRYLSTTNGDCIHRTNEGIAGFAGEFVFRSSSCMCPNGYVSYNVTNCKFYDFTIESNCRYGLLNPIACVCIGFRHREQIDLIRRRLENNDDNNGGALIIFTQTPSSDGIYSFKYITSDSLLWYSIDVTAVQGYDEVTSADEWLKLIFNGNDIGVPIRNERNVAWPRMYIIGNNKVFVPEGRKEIKVNDATVDFRLFDGTTDADLRAAAIISKYFATDYIIDVQHADIYFNASHGAIGYNDLTVTQTSDKTCTIYDKLGNVLFDGTELGSGKWSLKCVMDTTSFGRFDSYHSSSIGWRYDGTNEKWVITKIE